jgi:uncharacterized protein YcaQ
MQLDERGARNLLLAAQGITPERKKKATKRDVLEMIRRMGALQIDTIHVVARSPYFVLWSRLGDYEPKWLDELLEEGALFEYWSHEACFLPVEDYALYRRRMLGAASMGWKYPVKWVAAHRKEIAGVLDFIREQGAVRAADFERTDGRAGGWWEWKTEKRALETLFTAGELMIARRHNFQRVYDLRERVLSDWDDARLPSAEDVRRELALKAVRALGVTRPRWVADYFRTNMRETLDTVSALASEGRLLWVEVEGWNEPGLVHLENVGLLKKAAEGKLEMERTTLLSPFDPVVWDRKRASALFDFDYRIECYTPEAKRRYGYFTLPILQRGELVGRVDAKAHRQKGVFEVKSLHLEKGVLIKDELIEDLASAFEDCARWHKTAEIVIQKSDPKALAARLRRFMARGRKQSS